MPYSIMLDAGHGGRDPGAVYNSRSEKDDTLALTLAVGEILQSRGVDVLYTRTTDVYETPYQKAMEANEAGVDFFVSIHRNSSPEANTYSGVESLIFDRSGIKLEMAEDINDQLEAVGFINLGVKERPGLVVLRRTDMPAVLVEAGFINSDTDNLLFDNNFDDIAAAIADGILDTLQRNGDLPDGALTASSYTVQAGAFRNGAYADRLFLVSSQSCVLFLRAAGPAHYLKTTSPADTPAFPPAYRQSASSPAPGCSPFPSREGHP